MNYREKDYLNLEETNTKKKENLSVNTTGHSIMISYVKQPMKKLRKIHIKYIRKFQKRHG